MTQPAATRSAPGAILLSFLSVFLAAPSLGAEFNLKEVARYGNFGSDRLSSVAILNGELFTLQGSTGGQYRIVKRDYNDPTILIDSFDVGISSPGLGLAADNSTGLLYATFGEEDGDGMSAVYQIDPVAKAVVSPFMIETGAPWDNISGLSIVGDKLYGAATDGRNGPFVETIFEYDLSTGATLRSRNIDFLHGSNFRALEVIGDTVVAFINHARIDSGELHSFDLATLSYLGEENHSGQWVEGSHFDGAYLWLIEWTDFNGINNYELVKYAIPEPGTFALMAIVAGLAMWRGRGLDARP